MFIGVGAWGPLTHAANRSADTSRLPQPSSREDQVEVAHHRERARAWILMVVLVAFQALDWPRKNRVRV